MGPVTMGGEEAHDLLGAHQLKEECQHQIQAAGDDDAAQCVGQLLLAAHVGVDAAVQLGDGLEAAQKGEGGTQKCGDLELGADVEDQRAQTCHQQRGLDGQRQAVAGDQNGHQHRGAEHGEQMLQTQDQHAGRTQRACIVNGFLTEIVFHGSSSLSCVVGKNVQKRNRHQGRSKNNNAARDSESHGTAFANSETKHLPHLLQRWTYYTRAAAKKQEAAR